MTIDKNDVYYKLAMIFIGLGAIAISQSYLLGYKGEFNYTFFWIGILFAVIPTLIAVLNIDNQPKILILLFLFGALLYLPIIFWSPTYFRFTDEILHLNSLEMILEKGNLDINPIHQMSKYYPGLEFLTISFMKFAGLPLFPAAKILMGIVHSMILIFIYFAFKVITSSQKIAALGSIIYAANPGYIFFDALFSYETVGILLMIMLIYIIYRHLFSDNEKLSLTIISILTLFILVITHHFSSYMFSIFLILMFVSYYRYSKDNMKFIYTLKYNILTILLIVGWIIYFAQLTTSYFGNMVSSSFSSVLSFLVQGTAQREPFRLTTLPQYEIFIDRYIYIPLLFLLYAYCIYSIIRNRNSGYNSGHMPLILYGSMFFFSLPLIFTSAGKLFMYRSWSFIFIGLSFSVAIVLERLFDKKYMTTKKRLMTIPAFISIVLIIIGGISIGSSSSYRDPNYLDAAFPSSITLDVVRASDWFGTNFGSNNIILGDITIFTVFDGYGRQYVDTDPYLFYNQTLDSASIDYLSTNFSGRFIVIDNRITKKLSSFKYYFDGQELDMKDHIWGYTEPLPKQNIEKFNIYGGIYKIYDNGNINIYYIDRSYTGGLYEVVA